LQLVSSCPRCLLPLILALVLFLVLFKLSKTALCVHQAESHLLEIQDLLRHQLAGARVDLVTLRGNLGRRPMHYGTFLTQFCHCFSNTGFLDLWQARRTLRLQAALGVHLVAPITCRLPRQRDARDLATFAPITS
jgi:hypothetical protein